MSPKKLILILSLSAICQIQAQNNEKVEKSFDKFKQYYAVLFNYYYDTVDYNKLVESAIVKSLENLDPHSIYLPAKEANSENDRLRGNFEGIGIQYNLIRDTLVVQEVIASGPSEKIGIVAGDKLIEINDTVFAGKPMKADDYISRLRGKKGTIVRVKMLRNKNLIEFSITRDIIPIFSVDAAFMIDREIGYIRLNKFSANTPIEVDTAIQKLKSNGMKTLIFDLQNNGGGMLNASAAVSDQFLRPEQMIVYTKGLHQPMQTMMSSVGGNFKDGKLIILTNEHSASASEIVSGAVQDHDRGLVVGRRTFGKGLVQRIFTLNDNSQIRITTAEYFTPSGRCIQKPFSGDIKEYHSELLHRLQSGQLTSADTIKVPDSLMKYTDNKRKVFGGGGITPDVYVPIDTSYNSEYYFNILRKSLLNSFSADFANKNKASLLSQYPTSDDFVAKFHTTPEILNQLITLAEKEGIKRNDSSLVKSKILFETVLKANIGRNLYGSSVFYKTILDIDPIIQRAIKLTKENFSKYNVRNE